MIPGLFFCRLDIIMQNEEWNEMNEVREVHGYEESEQGSCMKGTTAIPASKGFPNNKVYTTSTLSQKTSGFGTQWKAYRANNGRQI